MAKVIKETIYKLELARQEALLIKQLVQNPLIDNSEELCKNIFEALPSFEELYGVKDNE